MGAAVSIEVVPGRLLAAVRRRVIIARIAEVWRPALDEVWMFLQQHPALQSGGHNVFLYHHPADRNQPMDADFGVEVTAPFAQSGEVVAIETPAGRVAAAVHTGPYDRLGNTHQAIHQWAAANNIEFAGKSWEIYGDWMEDAGKLETRIEYLLA